MGSIVTDTTWKGENFAFLADMVLFYRSIRKN